MRRSWIALTVEVVLLGALLAIGGCGPDSGGGGPLIVKPGPPLLGSCAPSSSLGILVQGRKVTSYVPMGNWISETSGLSRVEIEGTGIASKTISTPGVVNSCASNSKTGETVCVADNTDVYLISGATITKTLHSAGSGDAGFSGGDCTNCGVSMDAVDDQALIALSTVGGPGFQYLDLKGNPAFEPAFASAAGAISEDALVDPVHHLILSPTEANDYELINVTDTTSPTFFENAIASGGDMDSAAEDCSTGIALASVEFTSNIYVADLTQANFTAGTPGSWTAPSQVQNFPEFAPLQYGTDGIAVAQGTHTGIVTGEFGGDAFGAFQMPASSGTGTPAIGDYVECTVPSDPTPETWVQGDDPHMVSAYQSPNSGDAIGVLGNGGGAPPTYLAVIDLTKLLDTSVVARSAAHVCDPTVNLVTAGVVKFVAVP